MGKTEKKNPSNRRKLSISNDHDRLAYAHAIWDTMRDLLNEAFAEQASQHQLEANPIPIPCHVVYDALALYAALRAARPDMHQDDAMLIAARQVVDHAFGHKENGLRRERGEAKQVKH